MPSSKKNTSQLPLEEKQSQVPSDPFSIDGSPSPIHMRPSAQDVLINSMNGISNAEPEYDHVACAIPSYEQEGSTAIEPTEDLPLSSQAELEIQVKKQLQQLQLHKLVQNKASLMEKIRQLCSKSVTLIACSSFAESNLYLEQAEKIIEYAANRGKSIDRNLIIAVLYNRACSSQGHGRAIEIAKKAIRTLEAIINLELQVCQDETERIFKESDDQQQQQQQQQKPFALEGGAFESSASTSTLLMTASSTSKLSAGTIQSQFAKQSQSQSQTQLKQHQQFQQLTPSASLSTNYSNGSQGVLQPQLSMESNRFGFATATFPAPNPSSSSKIPPNNTSIRRSEFACPLELSQVQLALQYLQKGNAYSFDFESGTQGSGSYQSSYCELENSSGELNVRKVISQRNRTKKSVNAWSAKVATLTIRNQSANDHKDADSMEWLETFNIGQIMHMNSIHFEDFQHFSHISEYFTERVLVENLLYLSICFFTIATEIRFIELEQNSKKASRNVVNSSGAAAATTTSKPNGKSAEMKDFMSDETYLLSEIYHLKAIQIVCDMAKSESPYITHLINSYYKHYSYSFQQTSLTKHNEEGEEDDEIEEQDKEEVVGNVVKNQQEYIKSGRCEQELPTQKEDQLQVCEIVEDQIDLQYLVDYSLTEDFVVSDVHGQSLGSSPIGAHGFSDRNTEYLNPKSQSDRKNRLDLNSCNSNSYNQNHAGNNTNQFFRSEQQQVIPHDDANNNDNNTSNNPQPVESNFTQSEQINQWKQQALQQFQQQVLQNMKVNEVESVIPNNIIASVVLNSKSTNPKKKSHPNSGTNTTAAFTKKAPGFLDIEVVNSEVRAQYPLIKEQSQTQSVPITPRIPTTETLTISLNSNQPQSSTSTTNAQSTHTQLSTKASFAAGRPSNFESISTSKSTPNSKRSKENDRNSVVVPSPLSQLQKQMNNNSNPSYSFLLKASFSPQQAVTPRSSTGSQMKQIFQVKPSSNKTNELVSLQSNLTPRGVAAIYNNPPSNNNNKSTALQSPSQYQSLKSGSKQQSDSLLNSQHSNHQQQQQSLNANSSTLQSTPTTALSEGLKLSFYHIPQSHLASHGQLSSHQSQQQSSTFGKSNTSVSSFTSHSTTGTAAAAANQNSFVSNSKQKTIGVNCSSTSAVGNGNCTANPYIDLTSDEKLSPESASLKQLQMLKLLSSTKRNVHSLASGTSVVAGNSGITQETILDSTSTSSGSAQTRSAAAAAVTKKPSSAANLSSSCFKQAANTTKSAVAAAALIQKSDQQSPKHSTSHSSHQSSQNHSYQKQLELLNAMTKSHSSSVIPSGQIRKKSSASTGVKISNFGSSAEAITSNNNLGLYSSTSKNQVPKLDLKSININTSSGIGNKNSNSSSNNNAICQGSNSHNKSNVSSRNHKSTNNPVNTQSDEIPNGSNSVRFLSAREEQSQQQSQQHLLKSKEQIPQTSRDGAYTSRKIQLKQS